MEDDRKSITVECGLVNRTYWITLFWILMIGILSAFSVLNKKCSLLHDISWKFYINHIILHYKFSFSKNKSIASWIGFLGN